MNKKSKKNLPLYGIGPVIVFGQLLIAGGAIAISYKFKLDCYEYEILNIPLKIIGILSVIFDLLELYVTIIGCHGRKMAKRVVWKAI